MPATKDVVAVAYHEAGHAVVAHCLNALGAKGPCVYANGHGWASAKPWTWGKRFAAVAVAGPSAMAMATGWPIDEQCLDMRWATQMMSPHPITNPQAEASALLTKNWSAVERIAAALICNGFQTTEEIVQLIENCP